MDTCAQPDAVGTGDGSASGPQGLSWEAGLKGGSRKNASGTRVTPKPRIESPGHWVMMGAGTRTQTLSRAARSPPPSQDRIFPGVPPSRSETAYESSFHGWKSLEFAATVGYRGPPEGARRGAGAHHLEGQTGRASLVPRPRGGWSPLPG